MAGAGALALPASGYVNRQTVTWKHPDSSLAAWFLSRPEFAQPRRPIAMAGNLDGALVGDSLQHRLELIPPTEPCPDVMARLKRGWVVVAVFPRIPITGSPNERFPRRGSAPGCLRARRPVYASPPRFVYGPQGAPGRPPTG